MFSASDCNLKPFFFFFLAWCFAKQRCCCWTAQLFLLSLDPFGCFSISADFFLQLYVSVEQLAGHQALWLSCVSSTSCLHPMLECTLRTSAVNLAGGPDLLARAWTPGCPEIVVSCSSCSTAALQNADKKHRGPTDGNRMWSGGLCLCVFVLVWNERSALLLFFRALSGSPGPACLEVWQHTAFQSSF